jgi:broad specificity phosphatase PhoE
LTFLFILVLAHSTTLRTRENRFLGGESYRDLIRRLNSVVIDVEQQVIPTLVISHVSILQCLMAYFRNTPVDKCMSIEVPMHTVIKYTPVRGGGWKESLVPLFDAAGRTTEEKEPSKIRPNSESFSEVSHGSYGDNVGGPIWQDGMASPK